MKVISNSFANTQTGFTEGSFCWSNSRTQHMQTQAKFRGKYKCDRKIAQWKMPLCNKHVFCLLPFWGFSNFYVVRRARATILLRTAGGLTAYISACVRAFVLRVQSWVCVWCCLFRLGLWLFMISSRHWLSLTLTLVALWLLIRHVVPHTSASVSLRLLDIYLPTYVCVCICLCS